MVLEVKQVSSSSIGPVVTVMDFHSLELIRLAHLDPIPMELKPQHKVEQPCMSTGPK